MVEQFKKLWLLLEVGFAVVPIISVDHCIFIMGPRSDPFYRKKTLHHKSGSRERCERPFALLGNI